MIFAIGVGVGYLLGARAGRERFDQIVAKGRQLWESPTVQEAAGVVQAQAGRLYDEGKRLANDQLHRAGGRNGHHNGKVPMGAGARDAGRFPPERPSADTL
jgi:hypothetical protein